MPTTKVKICGNTSIEDAAMAAELGADYLGFIFTESKRKINPQTALEIIKELSHFSNFVGVFFNQPREEVLRVAEQLRLQHLQFHGSEPALYCDYFKSLGYGVIKSFRIRDELSVRRVGEYNVDAFLFDTWSKSDKGGTGQVFDWNLIPKEPFIREKLFLAGGLTPENVRSAIQTIMPFAIDVASGVETSPGKKSPELLKAFFKAVRNV